MKYLLVIFLSLSFANAGWYILADYGISDNGGDTDLTKITGTGSGLGFGYHWDLLAIEVFSKSVEQDESAPNLASQYNSIGLEADIMAIGFRFFPTSFFTFRGGVANYDYVLDIDFVSSTDRIYDDSSFGHYLSLGLQMDFDPIVVFIDYNLFRFDIDTDDAGNSSGINEAALGLRYLF